MISDYSEFLYGRRLKFVTLQQIHAIFVSFFLVLPLPFTFCLLHLRVSLLSFPIFVVDTFMVNLYELIPNKVG